MLEFLQRPAPLLTVPTVTFGCSGNKADDAPGKTGTAAGASGRGGGGNGGSAGAFGQWVFFDVTKVVEAP